MRLANGRNLPALLFVSSRSHLASKFGVEANKLISLIESAGQAFLDLGSATQNVSSQVQLVRVELKKRRYVGVVIVGGYDVVMPDRLCVLDQATKLELDKKIEGRGDSDGFIVWNDDCYGDIDGDGLPEIPVSRVVDGNDLNTILQQLCCELPSSPLRSCVRNRERPFAIDIFHAASKNGNMFVSEPTTPKSFRRSIEGSMYFMLHGRDTDSSVFWGEDDDGVLEAVNISNLPADMTGQVLFLGCCWGGLIALPRASKYYQGVIFESKTKDNSVAVASLARGANSVVGCTGTHYSPTIPPYNYFGGPMHTEFYNSLQRGLAPAQAVFEAKKKYAMSLPHGQYSIIAKAVELKLCREFTCLGLGW
jgi:hypothetical protein